MIILQNSSFLYAMAELEFLCTQGSSQQTGNKNKLYFYMCEKPIAFFVSPHQKNIIRIKIT